MANLIGKSAWQSWEVYQELKRKVAEHNVAFMDDSGLSSWYKPVESKIDARIKDGICTKCAFKDEPQKQPECKHYIKAINLNRCRFFRFDFLCDCVPGVNDSE